MTTYNILIVMIFNIIVGYHTATTNNGIAINVAASPPSSLLPLDCWERCYAFMRDPSDLTNFRLISRQHNDICRSIFRRNFIFFDTIFTKTVRQKRIRSWADVEREIPFNPVIFTEWQWMRSPYLSFYNFHTRSNKPIFCGISYFGTLFMSFHLEHVESDHNGFRWRTDTVLLCMLRSDRPWLRTTFIFDSHGHPNLLKNSSFGMTKLDLLLDGQAIQFEYATGFVTKDWRLNVVKCNQRENHKKSLCLLLVISLIGGSLVLALLLFRDQFW